MSWPVMFCRERLSIDDAQFHNFEFTLVGPRTNALEALTKNGRGVFRCDIDENPGGRLLEIP
jgi:hypothetical protein